MDFLHLYGARIEGSVLNCGSAYDRYKYHRFFPLCSRYRLLDLEPIRRWHGREPREVLIADAQDMPHVPSNSEDCLVAYWFVDYERLDQARIFSEFNRILKPGGILLISFNADAFPNPPYGRFTLSDVIKLAQDFFVFEDIAYHCESLTYFEGEGYVEQGNKDIANRFIIDGKRFMMTMIKARVNKF